MKQILQSEMAECGLACLAMISCHYDHHTNLVELRQKFPSTSRGLTLETIAQYASQMNLSPRALKLDMADLKELTLPCIIHWDLNHFVVLRKVERNHACIIDPTHGERRLSLAKFSEHFTGIAMELTPTIDFQPKADVQLMRLRDFWTSIVGFKRSIGLLILLSFILQAFNLVSPFYIQTIVDDVLLRSDTSLLTVLAIGFGLLAFVQVGTSSLRSLVILQLSTRFNFQIAVNLFRHLIRLPVGYFVERHIGDIVSRFGSLQKIKDMLTTTLVASVIDGFMVITTLGAMFLYSVKISIIVLVVVVAYIVVRLFVYPPMRRLTEERIIAQASEQSNFMETVRGVQTIKLFQQEAGRESRWQNQYTDTLNASVRLAKWNIGYSTGKGLLFAFENVFVLYLLASAIISENLTIGMMYAFLAYKTQFVSRVNSLIDMVIELKMLGLHLNRIADIALTKTDKSVDLALTPTTELSGALEVNKLNYRFNGSERSLLTNVSFKVAAGESVAIVGPSGCGKTTLIKLMMSLVEPTSGRIDVDGLDIFKSAAYRRSIAAVMQDDILFSGSIAQNIACLSDQVDMNWVVHCAQVAGVHDDILNMPMQYQTLVGDMGSSLSGGQKQRIMLARALYRRPSILFLDEATSHLDVKSESIVNDNIRRLHITRIIVAHRPETIKSADRVITINKGTVESSLADSI